MAGELPASVATRGSKRKSGYSVGRCLVKAVIEDQGLPKRLEEFIKEDWKPALEDAFEELLGLHPSTPALVQSVTRTILKLATAGGAVLIGRGAHIICAKLPHAFHARLVAPLESRVQHIADYFKLSKKDAAQYVEKADRARKQYVRRYFGVDVADPHQRPAPSASTTFSTSIAIAIRNAPAVRNFMEEKANSWEADRGGPQVCIVMEKSL